MNYACPGHDIGAYGVSSDLSLMIENWFSISQDIEPKNQDDFRPYTNGFVPRLEVQFSI